MGIRGNQWQSVAIRGNQHAIDTLGRNPLASSGNQWPSVAIRGYQQAISMQSTHLDAIHSRPVAISGNQRLSACNQHAIDALGRHPLASHFPMRVGTLGRVAHEHYEAGGRQPARQPRARRVGPKVDGRRIKGD